MKTPANNPRGSRHASRELRQMAIRRVLAGESPEAVIRELGFHRSRIYAWLQADQKARAQQEAMANHRLAATTRPTAHQQSDTTQTPHASPATENKTLPLTATYLHQWLLLLQHSLLDEQHPFDLFLNALNQNMHGAAVIAADLYNPAAMIRPLYDKRALPEFIRLDKHLADTWHDNPFLQARPEPGDILVLNELMPYRDWNDNSFCRLIRHYGARNAIMLCFRGGEGSLCGLFFYLLNQQTHVRKIKTHKIPGQKIKAQEIKAQKIKQQNKRFLARLYPHLEAAMALATRQWRHSFTTRALEEATDHLNIAALVLDGNGTLIKYNQTAAEILNRHEVFTSRQQLVFQNSGQQREFTQAVQNAIAWRREPIGAKPVAVMRCATRHGHHLSVMVQAITPPSMRITYSAAVYPHVMVYINDPQKGRPTLQQRFISRLFQLSPQEAKLTILLTEGHNIDAAATAMKITRATARTYLRHIYEKVGVNRRDELIKRVLQSVALLA